VIEADAAFPHRRSLSHNGDILMRNKLATILVALLMLSGSAVLLSACNTTAGAGKDISSAGRAITDTAEDAQ
jgi:predicted small secreted protein